MIKKIKRIISICQGNRSETNNRAPKVNNRELPIHKLESASRVINERFGRALDKLGEVND